MKKIFTLFALSAIALASQAAVPELLFKGQPITPGVTYQTGYTSEVTVDEIPGYGTFTCTSYKQDSELSVSGDKNQSVTVEVKATSKVQFCGIEDRCNMVTDDKRTNILGSAPGAEISGSTAVAPLVIDITVDDFDGVDPATLLQEITVEVTAYYTSTPSESTTTTVVLTNRPDAEVGGVVNITPDLDVNYTHGSINYNISAPTKLSIFNTNGSLVLCQLVKGVGSVALDSLHPGVYIYSIGGKSGKILVRK